MAVKTYQDSKDKYLREKVDTFVLRVPKGKKDEIMEYADIRSCICFQLDRGTIVSNNVNYLIPGHTAFADIIDYISDGKIIMECWNELFSYLRKAIIKSSNNPIRTAVVVTITG